MHSLFLVLISLISRERKITLLEPVVSQNERKQTHHPTLYLKAMDA